MSRSVAVIGGGIAGLAAAYELAKLQREGEDLSFRLIEASDRFGGIVETVCADGFVMETGPEAWVTEKPWARELAEEIGLGEEILPSNDEEKVTYVLRGGRLLPMPDGMRMMVPSNLDALEGNELFSAAAKRAFAQEVERAEELRRTAPENDESVAAFVTRHFGEEVLRVVGAPLLNGVFGGDVHRLSVQAVMMPFVKLEREHGSLIVGLRKRDEESGGRAKSATFTSLRSGMGSLVEGIVRTLPKDALCLQRRASSLHRDDSGWTVRISPSRGAVPAETEERFDAVMLAIPVRETHALLQPVDRRAAELVLAPTSSAVTVAFAYGAGHGIELPKGFGLLAPEGEGSRILAATFADQKYTHRVPEGGRLVRTYFGGATADEMMAKSDAEIRESAQAELERILGPLPVASHTALRRWPQALPQYELGHLERMRELEERIAALGNVALLGNGYRGVGVPDLIRDGRSAARSLAG